MKGEGEEILTNTVMIHFFPNSFGPDKNVNRTVNGKAVEELIRPQRRERAGRDRQAGRSVRRRPDHHRRTYRRLDEGPGARRGRSRSFAEAGQRGQGGAAQKYTDLDPNRFNVEGVGWDRPADPARNQTKNRRVEIKVFTAEKATEASRVIEAGMTDHATTCRLSPQPLPELPDSPAAAG